MALPLAIPVIKWTAAAVGGAVLWNKIDDSVVDPAMAAISDPVGAAVQSNAMSGTTKTLLFLGVSGAAFLYAKKKKII